MVLTMKKLVTSNTQANSGKILLMYIMGILKTATVKTHKNIEEFKRCITPWNLVFQLKWGAANTLRTDFLKFSAPPLFHLNCWDLAALITTGNSAGVSTSSRYLNFQFLSWAL